jgi:hypothetical protein
MFPNKKKRVKERKERKKKKKHPKGTLLIHKQGKHEKRLGGF